MASPQPSTTATTAGGGGGGTGGGGRGTTGSGSGGQRGGGGSGGGGSGGGGGGGRKPRGGRGRGRGSAGSRAEGGTNAGAGGAGAGDRQQGPPSSSTTTNKGDAAGGGSRRGRGGGGGGGRGGGGNKSSRGGKSRGGDQAAGSSKSTTVPGSANNNNNNNNSAPAKKNTNRQQQQQKVTPSVEEIQRQEEARQREEMAAAERTRGEAEAKAVAAAAAARRRQDEAVAAKAREAKEVLQGFLDTAERHRASREALEPAALAAARKQFEVNKKSLKTDLKKCTAFVKKVKSGSAWSMKADDLVRDVATLNLTRYYEEVAAAVLESRPKVTDLPAVVALCREMHQRYGDFLPNLLPALWEVVQNKGGGGKADPEAIKSRRLYIRMLTDFLLSGLLTESRALVKCVAEATGANSSSSRGGGGGGDDGSTTSYTVQDGNLVVAFCRTAGFEVFGGVPKSVREAAAWFQGQNELLAQRAAADIAAAAAAGGETTDEEGIPAAVLPPRDLVEDGVAAALRVGTFAGERAVEPDVAEVLTRHCLGAYQFMATSLVQTHGRLQKLEKRCEQDRLLSGSLTEAREQGLADARKLKENLQKSVDVLSDVLDQPVPLLEEDEDDGGQEGGLGVEVWTKGGNEDDDFGPFDDEETRDFYCDIPDLLATIPPVLLGMTPEQIERKKEENLTKYGKDFEAETDVGEDAPEVAPASEEELEAKENEAELEVDALDDADGENETEGDKDAPRFKLMVLLEEELPECQRREQIDEVTERFCTNHGSSKNSRKRLSRTLFLVPRNRFDLLPFYSRMAATVDRVWSDVSAPLVTELEQQFHGQAKFKKNQNLDARIKTARYIGELTKFRVAPPIVFLRCVRRCLDDFTGGNVDVACCLLESSGRFLYRLKHTNKRVSDLMETMARLSKAKNLDERSQALIKAAFYNVKPPPSGPRKQAKEYPPLETYLRRLLIERLVPTNSFVSFTAKQIIRLPWNDPSEECGALVPRIMMKACRKGRYSTIKAIALVAARLRSQRVAGEVTVRLVDDVLEELRWALEQPNFRDQQRVITYARLLGELFDASQVSGQLILRQLYEFIDLGHEIPEKLREASKRLAATREDTAGGEASSSELLPVYNSATGISQTINEDEEMEESELETREDILPVQPVAVSEHSKYDPRVPFATDPPNSAYRIKLACTLLEVAAKSIVTRNNIPRLKGFLAAFQRYLFTKSMMPTDVEFDLLDTFDILDSQWRQVAAKAKKQRENEDGFPRYATWLDAHNATVAVEESEALLETQGAGFPEAALEETKSLGTDAQSVNDDDDEEEDDDMLSNYDEDDESSQMTSAKDSVSEANVDGEDIDAEDDASDHSGSSEGEEDDDDSDASETYTDDEEEEFDEEAYMRQLEEEAFERELRRMTIDAIEKGKVASRKQVSDYMPAGSQIVNKKKAAEPSIAEPEASSPPSFALGGKAGISFQMLKRGTKGKMESKEIVVPKDTNLALASSKQDDEAARERDVIKQRVLQYEADSAYADEGGNVYLEQEKLQVIRNRPLSIEDIDRNFGTTGGSLSRQAPADNKARQPTAGSQTAAGRRPGRGGPSSGRGRGRSSASGRTLFR